MVTDVKEFKVKLQEKLNFFEVIEKCQEFFKEKNLNEYREKEKNKKIRILNFNNKEDEEDFYYFGETLSEDSPDVMEGFGFISNGKENEFILGNFKEDNFIKGIWIKNDDEIFLGEFIYNDTKDVCKKTNFKGVMLNKTEKFENFLFGEFDFIKSDFSGSSLKFKDTKEIRLDSGSFINNEKNCKDMLSLIIYDEPKEKNSTFKIIIASYEKDKLINDYYLMDDFSIIKINEEKNKYFSEIIQNGKIMFRGDFKNEKKDEINPIFQGQGILIDAEDNLRYKGNFENGKKEGLDGTLIVVKSDENKNFTLKKFEGEFKNDNFLKGNIIENEQKFIENGEFDENFTLKKGTIFHEKSEYYTGDFNNNKREGNGCYRYEDKKEYQGEWKQGNRHGRGTLFMEDRTKFITGDWEDNRLRKIIETTMKLNDLDISDSNNKEKGDDKYKSPKKEKKEEVYKEVKKEEIVVPQKKEEVKEEKKDEVK